MKKVLTLFMTLVIAISAICVPMSVQAASVGTVKNVKVVKTSNNSVKLKWKKVKGATGYQIYGSTKKNKGFKNMKTVKKGSTLTSNVGSLKAGKRYYFKVRAVKKKKKGKFSKVVTAKTKKNIMSVLSSGSATWIYETERGYESFRFSPKDKRVYYVLTGKFGEEDGYVYYQVKNNKVYFSYYNEDHDSKVNNEISLISDNKISVKTSTYFYNYGDTNSLNYIFNRA